MALLPHREHEDRPWGSFDRFTKSDVSTVKLIKVNPGSELSLQYHHHRGEFWHILTGSGMVTANHEERAAKVGDEFEIPSGVEHRIKAGPEGVWFLEIALGDFDENDIVRLEDDYGRASPNSA